MLVLGLLSAALGASNVFTLPALVVDGGGVWARSDVCISDGMCLSDAGGSAATGAVQWRQDSALDLTPVDAGPVGITVAAVDAGAGTIDATQYCIEGSACLTSWPAAGSQQWRQDSALDYTPIDAGIGITVAAVDGGFGVFSTLWSALSLGTFGGFGALDAGPTVVTTLNATSSSTSPLTLGAFGGFASVDAGFGVFSGANIGALTANSITDIGVGDFRDQVGAPAVDGGFGVFSTLWSSLSLGTFGGFASVDGGFGVFSTLWSPLSLGTFGGFGSIDAGPTVVTTLNATTSSTSPAQLGAFAGFNTVDAGGVSLSGNVLQVVTGTQEIIAGNNPNTDNTIKEFLFEATNIAGPVLIDGGSGALIQVAQGDEVGATLVSYDLGVNSYGLLTQGNTSTATSFPVPAVYGFDGGVPSVGTIQQPWHWETGYGAVASATNAGTLFRKAFTARPDCVVSLGPGTPTISAAPSFDAGTAGIWFFFAASTTAHVSYQCVGE